MAQSPSQDDVLEAARGLGKSEFSRDDVAAKLGIERSEMKPAWKAAKDSGRLVKVRSGEDGTNYFRVAGQ
jgi:hypothetical protein